ncbi:MAG: hypothetical protein WEB62_09400 [Bacteroidota bacterium]
MNSSRLLLRNGIIDESDDSVAIPVGTTRIDPQDRIVVFTLPGAITGFTKFFS